MIKKENLIKQYDNAKNVISKGLAKVKSVDYPKLIPKISKAFLKIVVFNPLSVASFTKRIVKDVSEFVRGVDVEGTQPPCAQVFYHLLDIAHLEGEVVDTLPPLGYEAVDEAVGVVGIHQFQHAARAHEEGGEPEAAPLHVEDLLRPQDIGEVDGGPLLVPHGKGYVIQFLHQVHPENPL